MRLSQSDRTQAKVDEFNKAVNEMNAAVNVFNTTNAELGNQPQKVSGQLE
jgi:hypothetical protein